MEKKIICSAKLPSKYGMIGKSHALKEIFRKIEKLSRNEATVLITGPTGCGKEVAAKAIHENSARKKGPFIAVNCGSIPAELFESELFGHERGAFTSALESKPGKFELAQGGTIFLDEIGNLPLSLQAKLLRVLQEKEIERLGGTELKMINVRIIAATNVDLKNEAKHGRFREDLYHRLNVVPLTLPNLMNRPGDIEYLISYFLAMYSEKYNNPFESIDKKALETLKKYSWPGNIRELKHLAERIVALESGPVLKYEYLPIELHSLNHVEHKGTGFSEIIESFAKKLIMDALHSYKGNQSQAARFLGLKRTTLLSKIKQYDLGSSYMH